MHDLTPASSLAEWVTNSPAAGPVLEQFQLDYCCGGQRSLAEACAERALPLATVVAELDAAHRESSTSEASPIDWSLQPLSDLCDHIEQSHHQYLREQLPRLDRLIEKVVAAHGARHPELAGLAATFRALAAELSPHLMKEEQILFPAIRRLEGEDSTPRFPFGSVQNPIRVMEDEHDAAGRLLHDLRQMTDGYTPPQDACETWKQLLRGLHELELDLHQHIHKENNLLFPAAARLEAR